MDLFVGPRQIGACAPVECFDNSECGTGLCINNLCSFCDPANPGMFCPMGAECNDFDGDGRFECGAAPECVNDTECAAPTGIPRCVNQLCYPGCTDDTMCFSSAFDQGCRTVGGTQVCLDDCPPSNLCADGSACQDYDGDAVLDCRVND